MRVEQLEYTVAVARLGSFRRAAEELHLSQPALSEAVSRLEAELSVEILDRGRSGTTISDQGRRLLPHMLDLIEAAGELRRAAADGGGDGHVVRLGTVTAATAPLLTPAIRAFRHGHELTQIEVVTAQQERIHRELREGGLDLGLVNYLGGEELPADLESTELLRGRPVLCLHPSSPLAARPTVALSDLAGEPLIGMRPGYVMHRFITRALKGPPPFSYAADGAEMGKVMVAEGLGATVLPDYSVAGDPLEQRGAITFRPIEDDDSYVLLVVERRRSGPANSAARDLHRLFLEHSAAYSSDAPAAA
jgi:DNA-binding transcriptional LysR family regulator